MKIIRGNKAFTIVEISVVVIIISFIIGCIYSASALIKQAKLKIVIEELYKYQTAFNNFKSWYDAIPGDMINANIIWPSVTTASGNGNNYIEFNTSLNTPLEDTYVFQHLYLAGVLNEAYLGGIQSGTRYIIGKNIPTSKYTTASFGIYTESIYQKTATYLEFASVNLLINGGILNSPDTSFIDFKIDDGLASVGNIMAVHGASTNSCVTAAASASSADYILTNNATSCKVIMYLNDVN